MIETLTAMGYREVTAEQVTQAGLIVPNESDVPDAAGAPGQGYQPPTVGESGVAAGTAMAGKPGAAGANPNQLFEPDPTKPAPLGDAGRRKLVT